MGCSNGMNFKRVKTKKQNKKLKRFQKRASRYYNKMMKTKSFNKSKNLQKLETLILKQHQRISNLRKNNIHQATTKLINPIIALFIFVVFLSQKFEIGSPLSLSISP